MPNLFLLLLTLTAHADGLQVEENVAPAPPAAEAPAAPPSDLPVIDGMPQAPLEPALTTSEEVKAAPGGDEPNCKAKVDPALRAMAFRHFQNLQEMHNSQGRYFPDKAADKASHLLGMIPKESAGDTNDVTDMDGKEYGTYKAVSSLERWRGLFSQPKIKYNKQTNYGLAQQSMDRMMVNFTINSKFTEFLGPSKDSGVTVRKILNLYQDFARGRLSQNDKPIPEAALKDPKAPPELKERARKGVQAALWHCGTRFMFKEGYSGAEGRKALEDAMASIAYCDSGVKKPDPNNDTQAKCFARWVTLCPALNVDIAILSPDSYFATRKAQPLCQETFKKLTKKK